MKPACERCAAPLPPTTPTAYICSFECTWCADCATGPLGRACRNCGGALRPRPPRGERRSLPEAAPEPAPEPAPGAAPGEAPGAPRVVRADALRALIPGAATATWPQGEPFVIGLEHGSLSLELYAPVGTDRQTPHERDEVYVVESGRATLRIGETSYAVRPGDVALVRAGEDHRFEEFEAGFATWVLFWGPIGGEL